MAKPNSNVKQLRALGVGTIDDMLSINAAYNGLVCIVNDSNHGGTFHYDTSVAKNTHNGGTIFDNSLSTFDTETNWLYTSSTAGNGVWVRQYDGAVNVKWFGAKGDGITNDFMPIQHSLFNSKSVYVPAGEYLTSETIRVSNKRLFGDGIKSTVITSIFYGTQFAVLTLGNEGWQSIGEVLFGGSIESLTIKRANSGNYLNSYYVIGLLLTGSRNANIEKVQVENHRIGFFVENTSEATLHQTSDISSNWGYVFDNRGIRTASERPGGYNGNTDGDVSSITITGIKSYYAQHSGVVMLNCGTVGIYSGTIGRFGESPSTVTPYGLPVKSRGLHIYGSSNKWTRGGSVQGVVFEADGREEVGATCIGIEATTINNPVSMYSIKHCEVQTYDRDLSNGIFTTFLDVTKNEINTQISVSVADSGFTPNPTGYYTGRFIAMDDTSNVVCNNIYPLNSLSNSVIGRNFYLAENKRTLLYDDMTSATVGLGKMPVGWTAVGDISTYLEYIAATNSSHQRIRLKGGSASEMGMYFTQYYRTHKYQAKVPYVKIVYSGSEIQPYLRVNLQSDTFTNAITSVNAARYGNVLYQANNTNAVKVKYFAFPQFSAAIPFDVLSVYLTLNTTDTGVQTDIYEVEIGYIERSEDLQVFS